ncbi:hypothetical protein BKA80DRAFT_259564 [Phyllosticta citrichinensis]
MNQMSMNPHRRSTTMPCHPPAASGPSKNKKANIAYINSIPGTIMANPGRLARGTARPRIGVEGDE